MSDESQAAGADRSANDEVRRARDLAQAGLVMASSGRLVEAEQYLRQADRLLAHDPVIAFDLARVILSRGRAADALALVDQTLTILPDAANLLLLRAQILLAAQRPELAIPAFQRATDAAPELGLAELGLAMALGQSRQPRATEAAARRAIKKGADSAGARYVLGRALAECSRFEEAESEFRHALQMRRDDVQSLTALAELLWMRSGRFDLATGEIDVALAENPALSPLRVTKAKLFAAAGNTAGAVQELERGLSLASNDVSLRLAAAQILLAVDPVRALVHAERAIQSAPRDSAVVAIYGDALFCAGRMADAGEAATLGLQIKPGDNHSLALLHSVWRALGDPRRIELSDYATLARACQIDTPSGWPSLDDYLQDLARSLHRLHRLEAQPVDQTLRFGSQVEIADESSPDPAIAAFTQAIDGPITRYMQLLGRGADVVRRRNTLRYRLNGLWSVRLKPRGHHLNHFHGNGWLSSACYIELPDALGAHNGEGWLKFGEPAFAAPVELGAEYFIKPEPGLLALFPSWMWHGTVPFCSDPTERRLTMAFDVVPI